MVISVAARKENELFFHPSCVLFGIIHLALFFHAFIWFLCSFGFMSCGLFGGCLNVFRIYSRFGFLRTVNMVLTSL